ncbi:MAG: hypothetical protein D6798_07110, partial [Deltaproteobacteria bacterium]
TAEELATMHGDDERVSIDTLTEGLRILYRAVTDVVAEGGAAGGSVAAGGPTGQGSPGGPP